MDLWAGPGDPFGNSTTGGNYGGSQGTGGGTPPANGGGTPLPYCGTNGRQMINGYYEPCQPGPLEPYIPLEPIDHGLIITDLCATAKNAAKKMDTLHANAKVDSTLATMGNLSTLALEKGFPIFQNFKISPSNRNDTSFITVSSGATYTGTATGINHTFSYNPNITMPVAAFHTHPKDGYSAQSAFDMYTLIEDAANNTRYAGNFVAAANGSQYVVTITDPALANAFLATKANYLDDATKGWTEGSDIGKSFKSAEKYYSENVYNGNPNKGNLSYEMAMAAALKQFNVGITLNKKDASGNFKPIVIITTVIPRQGMFKPAKTIYTLDCQ